MSVIGVSLVAAPYAIARFLVGSKILRWGAVFSLVAYASSRNYRKGEGILSPRMSLTITPGEGMGGILYEWGKNSSLLKEIRGKKLSLTKSEATSLAALVQAVQESNSALPALEDFIQNFPRL